MDVKVILYDRMETVRQVSQEGRPARKALELYGRLTPEFLEYRPLHILSQAGSPTSANLLSTGGIAEVRQRFLELIRSKLEGSAAVLLGPYTPTLFRCCAAMLISPITDIMIICATKTALVDATAISHAQDPEELAPAL